MKKNKVKKQQTPKKEPLNQQPPVKVTSPQHSAKERIRAVLSIWTEHRKPAEICREMNINPQHIHNWQDRALKGMMQALEPRLNLEKGPALPPRLQKYLERRISSKQVTGDMNTRLENRLQKIQSTGM